MRNSILKLLATTFLFALALSPDCSAQVSIAGDWQGTLSAGGAELRLVFHFAAAKDGSLSGTMDSVDQGAKGIPIDSVTLKDAKLTLTMDALHGTYKGTVNSDASAITGTWSQGTPIELNLKRAVAGGQSAPKPAAPSDIDGTWMGSLDLGGVKLRIFYKIQNTSDGLTASMQSPDQTPAWTAAYPMTRDGSGITIPIKANGSIYEGKISANLVSIDGTFKQAGGAYPLALKRAKEESELVRPQNPVKPYPYRAEDVTYAGPAAGENLAATLTIPQGKGPFPAVLLISGSGPNGRDESVFGHKPFLVLSDYLTRKGILVLRADKRGIGKSTGNYAAATSADFADDAEAGVRYLKTRPEVDSHRIGLVGHSEGGTIAPMVAARNRDVAFIVLLAGTGVPGIEIIPEQMRLIALAAGEAPEKVAKANGLEKQLLAVVVQNKDDAAIDKKLREISARQIPDAQIGAQVKALTSPWLRSFLAYDPAIALRKVQCPVLALNGSLDLQVSPAQNLPAIRDALSQGGNRQVEAEELPGLNHLFQTAKTGSPSEYGDIEETLSPIALDKVAIWILKQDPQLVASHPSN